MSDIENYNMIGFQMLRKLKKLPLLIRIIAGCGIVYIISFYLCLSRGMAFGKECGFSNGYLFVRISNKNDVMTNLMLRDFYWPLVVLHEKHLDGPYFIHSDGPILN